MTTHKIKIGDVYKITNNDTFVSSLIGVIFKVTRLFQKNYRHYANIELISCPEEVRKFYFSHDKIIPQYNIKVSCEKYEEVQQNIL